MNRDQILNELCQRFPALNFLRAKISDSAELIINGYVSGGKLLICGNGGSSADADHVVGELMKSFESVRPLKQAIAGKMAELSGERGKYLSQKLEGALPAISLSAHTSLSTAISNDMGGDLAFAQQVIGYGNAGDVLLAISTSGNSQNVTDACIAAKALEMKVIGLTGSTGGKMKQFCDTLLNVPEKRTAHVQELHLPVLHTICLIVENHFYPDKKY